VEASRTGQGAAEIPSGVTVITAAAIRQQGIADTVQALEKLGGLYFRRVSGNPSQAEVAMRGFGENAHGRVLVLVDGQRLNEPDMAAPNWSRIPVQAIERIEILHGGQTALYGNYAVAGVINIITATGHDPMTSGSLTGGSDDTYGAHLRRAGSLGDDTRYAADLDWQKSRGYRENAQYETYDLRAHIEHDWTERFASSVGGFYNWGDYGMPGGLPRGEMYANPKHSDTPQDYARSESWGVSARSTGEFVDWGTLGMDVVFQRRVRQARFPASWAPSDARYAISTLMLSPKYVLDRELGGFGNRFTIGSDLGYDALDYTRKTLPTAAREGDAALKRFNAAGYARDECFLTEALSVVYGVRLEWMRTSVRGQDFGTRLGGSRADWQHAHELALLFRPEPWQKYFLRASALYRYPFMDEMAFYQGMDTAFNSRLKPETGWQVELGASLDITDELTWDLRLYRLAMNNEIAYVYDMTTWTGQNENLDRTCRYGAEAAMRWSPAEWGSYGVAYNWVDARFSGGENRDNLVPLVPAHVLSADAEIQVAFGVSVFGAMRAVCSQYPGGDKENAARRMAGYALFDVGCKYKPGFLKGASVMFSCDNVFDKTYASSGFGGMGWDYYYPANGRTWRLTASYEF